MEVDVPDALQDARVPALLLQPIVENAIKYGVAQARGPVTLRIAAAGHDKRLKIVVENSAGAAASPSDTGTGVGLANVRQRLSVRFAGEAGVSYGKLPDGGFRVTMTMPLVTNV